MQIKVQCPAKINLNLKILNKRPDGFHNIESVMQTINLFDYLTIRVHENISTEILLSGNSNEIPYNETNLVYKAAKLFCETFNKACKIEIFIEKNIPVAAGLAGGSTDAAGVLFGLSHIFNCGKNELHNLCAKLGSDLNVCLQGGKILAKGRGEIIKPLEFEDFNLSLIKPLNLGISAKEAYEKYGNKILKQVQDNEQNMYNNDLEWAVIDDYRELQYIKQKYPNAIMTGSGSTYFIVNKEFDLEQGFWVKNGLKAINYGIQLT